MQPARGGVAGRSHTGTQAPRQRSSAAYPHQWMLLAPYGECEPEGSSPFTADPRTVAATGSSRGYLVSVSLHVAPPPALSRVCVRYGRSFYHPYGVCATVVGAHGDSVLILIHDYGARDYFIYNVGAADDPQRPPSLSLLRPAPTEKWRRDPSATGLLRRGKDDLVVVELLMPEVTYKISPPELLVFRSGEWCVMRPRMSSGHRRLLSSWSTSAVVPLGDGSHLCWVDFSHGVIFSNVFDDEKKPTLRCLPYPAEAKAPCSHGESFLCIDPRGGALNLVNVTCRRCSHGGCSDHAHDIRTWTLNVGDKAWVTKQDTVDDSAELRSLDCCCSGYARVQLVYPVGSLNGGNDDQTIPGNKSNAAAPPTEPEDVHVAGKGQKRQIYQPPGPRRSKRATKRSARFTGTEWASS